MSVTLWEELQFGRHLLAFARDPSKIDRIRRLAEVSNNLKDPTPAFEVVERAMKNPGYRELAARKYQPAQPDLAALAKLRKGTLGREFADHMERNQLPLEFLNPAKANQDIRFLAERQIYTHDIFHVLMDYDTSIEDEVALQAFGIAQLPSGMNVAILVALIMNVLRARPGGLGEIFDAVADGYSRGKRAKFLLGIPWEENWDRPLDELREMALISPRRAEKAA